MQSRQIPNNWRTLLVCTAGPTNDPDVHEEPMRKHQSLKARRDRFVPLKDSNKIGVGRGRDACYPRELLPFENDLYSSRNKPYAIYNDSFGVPSSTTVTTSSSTANDSMPYRRSYRSRSDQELAPAKHLSNSIATGTPSLTITASQSDVSFLSFDIDDDDAAEEPGQGQGPDYLNFFRRRASECFDRFGIEHGASAQALLELGMAHLRCKQFTAAQEFFRTALRVFEKLFGPNDLRVAKTLESQGIAQSRGDPDLSSNSSMSSCIDPKENKAGLLLSLQSFRKCFRIRYDVLGPTHIDAVETLNKISNIYMKLGMFSSAKNDYMEVLTLRTAILGNRHPSVAVAAQSLGMAHFQLNEIDQAKAYFLQALNIFALTGLANHPMADQLRASIRMIGFDPNRVEI